jgi:hypothetical protein
VNITNIGGGTLSWNASDNAAWLSVSPTAGTNGGSTTVAVNLSSLAAGTYTTAITAAAAGATNTPQVIPVTLTVASPTSASPTTSWATLTWNTNTEADLAGYKVYRGTSPGTYGAPIATLQGNVTNYLATGLQLGTTYYVAVTTYETAGNESVYSNDVSKSVYERAPSQRRPIAFASPPAAFQPWATPAPLFTASRAIPPAGLSRSGDLTDLRKDLYKGR